MTQGPADRPPPQAGRRVLRAALLRPWALLVLAIGAFFFATTLTWWAVPLTLGTYAALVALAVRDPIFRALVLEGRDKARLAARARARRAAGITPEARARRLPRGERSSKVEAALQARGQVIVAIEGSGEPTRRLLGVVVPELQQAAELLVDLAEAREQAPDDLPPETPAAIDAEFAEAPERFQHMRSEVVRASIETGDAAAARTRRLEESLRETNRRLKKLHDNLQSGAAGS